jgi:hypothetical protein
MPHCKKFTHLAGESGAAVFGAKPVSELRHRCRWETKFSTRTFSDVCSRLVAAFDWLSLVERESCRSGIPHNSSPNSLLTGKFAKFVVAIKIPR